VIDVVVAAVAVIVVGLFAMATLVVAGRKL
jgi:hypothetical protein